MTPNTAPRFEELDPFAEEQQPPEEQQVDALVLRAKGMMFKTADDVEAGRDFIKDVIRPMRKQIEDHHRPIIDAAHKAHKMAMGKMKELLEPLDKAEKIVRTGADTFLTEQARIQAEERRKREEEERKRHQEAIDKAKELAEKLASDCKEDSEKIAALTKALNEQMLSDIEAATIRSQIAVLEASAGQKAQVSAQEQYRLEQEAAVQEPIATPEPEKIEGVSGVKDYDIEVVDLKTLCAAIGHGDVPACVVKEVKKELKTCAKQGTKLPGCRVTQKTSMRVR